MTRKTPNELLFRAIVTLVIGLTLLAVGAGLLFWLHDWRGWVGWFAGLFGGFTLIFRSIDEFADRRDYRLNALLDDMDKITKNLR